MVSSFGSVKTSTKRNKSLPKNGPKDRTELLAFIMDKLATSIDHDITLQEVAQVLVPIIADYSRVAIVDGNKQLKEISVSHKDPSKEQLATELFDNYIGKPESTHGVEKILRSGRAEIIKVVDVKVLSTVKNNKPLYETVKKIGLKSYMGVPLIARGKVIGAITFSSVKKGRYYTNEDLKFVKEVAYRIALALDNIRLYRESIEEIAERKKIEKKLKEAQADLLFLAEASKVLSSSLDYKTTLKNVARLAIPRIADWYVVDLLTDNGTVELLTVAHNNPKKVKWARKFRKTHPVSMNENTGLAKVLKTGKSEFYPKITDEMLQSGIKNVEDLVIIRSLDFTSIMMVPLLIRGKTLGAITFVTTSSKRNYTKSDLAMAEKLAGRTALVIQNAKLYSDAKKAVAIREEFISVASHELKTPLTSLKLYSQALEEQYKKHPEADLLKYFQKIDIQINKLSMLIDDLLNVTKIEHGKMNFNMGEFDLIEVIEEAVDGLSLVAKDHAILIKGKLDKKVFGDRYRIYQVITNLLINAIKYSPGGKKVIIAIESKKNKASVTVKDFGIGVDKSQLVDIFKQFYRVTGPVEKTYPGLGMGLYIASEIIKRHDGEMSVNSVKGKGSEFSFTIPFKKDKYE